jgi:hypothetical protein
MSDTINRLMALRDRIDELAKQETARAEKLETEVADMEIKLALAAALTALKKGTFDSRDLPQAMGAKALIKKVLAA